MLQKNACEVKYVLHGIAWPGGEAHICQLNTHPQHET